VKAQRLAAEKLKPGSRSVQPVRWSARLAQTHHNPAQTAAGKNQCRQGQQQSNQERSDAGKPK